MYQVSKKVIDEVDKIILDFMWNGGTAKIAKSTLIQSIDNGVKSCMTSSVR